MMWFDFLLPRLKLQLNLLICCKHYVLNLTPLLARPGPAWCGPAWLGPPINSNCGDGVARNRLLIWRVRATQREPHFSRFVKRFLGAGGVADCRLMQQINVKICIWHRISAGHVSASANTCGISIRQIWPSTAQQLRQNLAKLCACQQMNH